MIKKKQQLSNAHFNQHTLLLQPYFTWHDQQLLAGG